MQCKWICIPIHTSTNGLLFMEVMKYQKTCMYLPFKTWKMQHFCLINQRPHKSKYWRKAAIAKRINDVWIHKNTHKKSCHVNVSDVRYYQCLSSSFFVTQLSWLRTVLLGTRLYLTNVLFCYRCSTLNKKKFFWCRVKLTWSLLLHYHSWRKWHVPDATLSQGRRGFFHLITAICSLGTNSKTKDGRYC